MAMIDPALNGLDEARRREHERWLLEVTAIPTAAGREDRVIGWIRSWLGARPDLVLKEDRWGNMEIAHREAPGASERPALYITAHLDHPAFVVEQIVGPGTVRLSFRGGVLDPYFADAPIEIVTADDGVIAATLMESSAAQPYRDCLAELDSGSTDAIAVGDIARWSNPAARVTEEGVLETHACDDLAAVAAALGAMDVLRGEGSARHVRLLFTRAEEVGFIGAIAAMRDGWIDKSSRLVLLENSRAYPESPIGGGPIVRVGDRMSTFSPSLTSAFAGVAERIAKHREEKGLGEYRWQRKLMPGGACEATVFQAWGYEATCLCLPLGNYHNMANLAAVQAKDPDAIASARCGPEQIAVADFHGLVDLLVGAGLHLADVPPMMERLEKLFEERGSVLGDAVKVAGSDSEGAAWGLTRGA